MSMFDKSAKLYDSWYETKLGEFVDRVETRCAFELLDLNEGAKILDVGCGSGNFSIKLGKMGYEVTGIDLSMEMLALAKDKAEKESVEVNIKHMDVTNLLFEDESFDAIFSMATFEFIPDFNKALNEMMRVLKTGGQMVIGTIHRDSKWGEFYNSEKVQKKSVFKYAKLKSMNEMKMLYPENLVGQGECLFIPPDVDEKNLNEENEERLKALGESGGFICLKWIK
ncbi:MAG: class I SAM-dependent methyltransferase [Clostridiales bacterium]|nr:class I SAM-dependent methyltransferase [Clostridiales bacterium]